MNTLLLLAGFFITSASQVDEVINNVNAVGFAPQNYQDTTEYLSRIDNRAVPIIFVDQLYQVGGEYVYQDPILLKSAISASGQFGRVIFAFDEPFWRARRSGQNPEEVKQIMSAIRKDFPSIEFLVVHAYAELFQRYIEGNGKLNLWYEADHVGFDCYGDFHACGGGDIPLISQSVYATVLYNDMQRNGNKAKFFAVPGAMMLPGVMNNEQKTIEQLYDYAQFINANREYVSGMGIFSWGDVSADNVKGARNYPELIDAAKHTIDMVMNYEDYLIQRGNIQ